MKLGQIINPQLFVLIALMAIVASCSTTPPSSEAAKNSADPAAKEMAVGEPSTRSETAASTNVPKAVRSVTDIENLTIEEVIRIEEPNTANLYDNSRYDFPITVNSKVEGWIDYFTGRGRPHMERYLGRASRYTPVMRQILKKNGLPEDLVYLALIESGFNLTARSRARAVGPWQFMKATGKRYGLRVDAWVDERRDPLGATVAAARYLKDLYLMFESWYLAASAYNAGEYKILRAIEEVKTHNYWRISQTSAIRRETKDYIPKLIAAAIIAKNPAKYGFDDIDYEEPLEFDTVSVDFPIHLREIAKIVDVSEDDIYELNPHFARHMIPPEEGPYDVRVPVGRKVVVERAVASLRTKGTDRSLLPMQHTVKFGETLRSVSNRYRIKLNELALANNLSPKEAIKAGFQLIIPNRTPSNSSSTTKAPKTAKVAREVGSTENKDDKRPSLPGTFITHTVKKGESLWSISEEYDVTVQQIFKWNNLSRSRINPGTKLKIKSPDRQGTNPAAKSTSRLNKRRGPRAG